MNLQPVTIARPESDAEKAGVEIRNLRIGYRRRAEILNVISDVNLTIAPGEAYGLVGESGCGKSTLALALVRYLATNAVVLGGQILVRGEDILTMPEERLRQLRGNRIAMVYQDPGSSLNPSMRIGAQIAEVFRYHRAMPRDQALEASREALERVRIPAAGQILRRYPHELSGGQQQRVIIAMALATDPDLLILDEPTTGLDATVEAEVLDLVERLRDEVRASILFISHNLGVVSRICERVGILYAGELIEEGHTARLFEEPHHPYTLALLRCVPRLGMRKNARRLDPIPGAPPVPGEVIPGCSFVSRCPLAREQCATVHPELLRIGPDRYARCFYHEQVHSIAATETTTAHELAAPKDRSLLRLDGVVKTYKSAGTSVTAVAGVDLEVREGEILGIVGESGSGKTSLARCVVGLTDTSAGTITFDGNDLGSRRSTDLRRRLQMVFQNPDTSLNPRHSVRRILGRSVRLLGGLSGTEEEARIDRLADAVRLQPHHLDAQPSALSGGLKQRVGIARAFAGSPTLVLCDEPTSALDVSVQAAILNLLVDLQQEHGASYIYITHDLAVVKYIADRIGVMYLGEIIDFGPAELVFSPPHHPYTETLISAMSTLDAPQRERIHLTGTMPSPADPPTGCRFHTRCPRMLGSVCQEQPPPVQQQGEHIYRCHIPPDELEPQQRAS